MTLETGHVAQPISAGSRDGELGMRDALADRWHRRAGVFLSPCSLSSLLFSLSMSRRAFCAGDFSFRRAREKLQNLGGAARRAGRAIPRNPYVPNRDARRFGRRESSAGAGECHHGMRVTMLPRIID